jgi:glutamate synthase (NADPH/NADH) large chain
MQELYRAFKDNCGFGLLASIDNKPTHKNVEDAITALSRMMHRGAIAADGKSGDGSGLLFSLPKEFFKKIAKESGIDLPDTFGIGVIFATNEKQKEIVQEYCQVNDLKVVLWREVPVNTDVLGELALKSMPKIYHAFIVPNSIIAIRRFEELLYLTRKEIEHSIDDKGFYIPTFSSKKIAYKGLLMPNYIKDFYKDLQDKDFKISFALFHQRFSTNTLPEWRLAQPFRFIAHNGEINSVEANRINSLIKTESIKSSVFTKDELDRLLPIVRFDESDSSSLDRMIEFLIMNGMDFFKAVRALIPMPWQNAPSLDSELKAFYEYFSTRFEAWDGPAAVSVTDGRYIGVVLDRNGLRPAKYIRTKDNRMIITSEFGVLDLDEDEVVERGKLQSGQMIGIDTKFGVVLKNNDIDNYLKSSNPYTKWLNQHMVYLQEYIDDPYAVDVKIELEDMAHKQRYAGITKEVVNLFIKPLLEDGKEPTGSMGDDTPLACFSNYPFRSFNDFFRQKFAQVTNPPIDSLREKIVMSLNTGFGETHNILDEEPTHAKRIKASSPILTHAKLNVLKSFGDEKSPKFDSHYKYRRYYTAFKSDLKASLEELVDKIVQDVKNDGVRIIILDDCKVSKELKAIPMALVIGRLHKKLLDNKVRHLSSIVAKSAEVITAHDAAVFLAYGATAIYPYMLFKTVCKVCAENNLDRDEALFKTHSALNKGILKIMSKMGISTVASYRNSGLFDVIGLSKEMVQECFVGSKVILNGLDYSDIEEKINKRHQEAFKDETQVSGGVFKYRKTKRFTKILQQLQRL